MAQLNWDVDAFMEQVRSDVYKKLLNAATAVQESARSLCPVKTGRLRDSITVTGNGEDAVSVGTEVPYAADVEFGHVRKLKDGSEEHVPAQPFLVPALEGVTATIRDRGSEAFE